MASEPASKPEGSAGASIDIDVLIVGGGITGLWTLNALASRGYSVLLAEREALGAGQTIAAQGVIHGGLKYAGGGLLTDASKALAAMPDRWRACFEGNGEVDLGNAARLSPCQHLWTKGGATSAVAGFFASKLLKSQIRRLKRDAFPAPLDHGDYRGHVFELGEFVVDTSGVLRELACPHADRIVRATVERLEFAGDGPSQTVAVELGSTNGRQSLRARHVVLTAGAGNAACLEQVGLTAAMPMQRRPLHQVLVKHSALPPFFSVCLGTGPKPPVVCTTHRHADGTPVWYLGGDLAETGVQRSGAAQVREARKRLDKLLPWVDLGGAEWATLQIDRAESETPDRSRHPGAWVETSGPITAVWPSKLALAPDAADRIVAQLQQANVTPGAAGRSAHDLGLAGAPLEAATAPWDAANYSRLDD